MKGGTLFSGIGAPEVSAPDIDWRWSAEIDRFASAVLAARFPATPNLGDVTQVDWDAVEHVDIVVFGSPCQSFSVAGKRLGLDDPRGNLALVALSIVDRIRPRWLVFENVPGLFSNFSGSQYAESQVREGDVGGRAEGAEDRDFAAFLTKVRECGYLGCWRVFDAQFAGVPQRRERVFFVGCLGDWRGPCAVLFEPESLSGDPPPSREAGEDVARPIASCAPGGSGYRADSDTAENLIAYGIDSDNLDRSGEGADGSAATRSGLGVKLELAYAHRAKRPGAVAYGGNRQSGPIDVATAVNAYGGPHGRQDFETETFVTHSLRADGFDASEDGTGRGTLIIPIQSIQAVREKRQNGIGIGEEGDPLFTLTGRDQRAIAFTERTRADGRNFEAQDDLAYALCNPGSGGRTHSRQLLDASMAVRRLTPRECERLQGFPDDFTFIRFNGMAAADGPRYRALGNAMARPVIGWILDRVAAFERLMERN